MLFWNPLVSNGPGHDGLAGFTERFPGQVIVKKLGQYLALGSHDNEFTGAEADAVLKVLGNTQLPVLEARCDLRAEHVAIGEVGVALHYLTEPANRSGLEMLCQLAEIAHRHERDW